MPIALIVALLTSGFSLNAMKINYNLATLMRQFDSYVSVQDHIINVGKDLSLIGANATNSSNSTNSSSAYLIGKTKVSSLPSVGTLPKGSPAHLIPFHPKNASDYSAAKKRANLGIINNSNIKVFSRKTN